MIDRFDDGPETRWRFFTDGVMGGVSQGRVTFLSEAGQAFARMEGTVSTENRGGFIQMRRDLERPPTADVSAAHLTVRGNGERYFVHLRTTATRRPWHYFQAPFATGADWTDLRLPFGDFAASGQLLRPLRADEITSIAVAAYGRDHAARVDVREIGFV